MRYVSTRGDAPELDFGAAMMTGLARDGGLYVPKSIPVLSEGQLRDLAGLTYEELALEILHPFVSGCFSAEELAQLIGAAYAPFAHVARAPLRQLAPDQFLMELFHGPTLAFKDFAMRLIAQMMQAVLDRTGERVTIVGATSGDTGSAAIDAFRGLANVDVFILYPESGVSEVQRRQMTTPSETNVYALALSGSFDDAQARLKDLFNDHAFRDGVHLAGVNSINWARILAQVVYYFHAALSLGAPGRPVAFSVPTGNFGDIYAGSIAQQMGLPISKLVVATNQNDILDRALRTGDYCPTELKSSISPSMDIQVSSNFERALHDATQDSGSVKAMMLALQRDKGFHIADDVLKTLRARFASGSASETETLAAMKQHHRETGELICPHTAVGIHVARLHAREGVMVTLATASPAKFPDAVELATGIRPALPPMMANQLQQKERITRMANETDAIKVFVREQTRR